MYLLSGLPPPSAARSPPGACAPLADVRAVCNPLRRDLRAILRGTRPHARGEESARYFRGAHRARQSPHSTLCVTTSGGSAFLLRIANSLATSGALATEAPRVGSCVSLLGCARDAERSGRRRARARG